MKVPLNWLRKKRPVDTCEHAWGQPRHFNNYWLKSYWTAKCRSCGAVVGRATEGELREALTHLKQGIAEEPARVVTADPEKHFGPPDR